MRKLSLVALAASAALIPGAALAQHHDGGQAPMPPGVGAHHSPAGMHNPGMPHPGMNRPGMHRPGMQRPGMGHVRRFGHIPRIDRGGRLPRPWFGTQFHVQNWGMYGFPQPFAGGRWVRYYDDALLIDRDGRVHDGRYGMDWDRYGDSWGYDDRGVPVYVGDGDYEPDDEDYERSEGWERRGHREEYGREEYGRGGHGYGGRGQSGYGYGYGSYGCGCGPVVVTETVTTTAPVYETRTWYEDVVEYVDRPARAVRRHVKRPVRRAAPAPAPRPRPGERG
jgi:Ni/Co efflux regulator RcnB